MQMQIYSRLLHASIELDAYINNDQNIIITHKSLSCYLQEMEGCSVSYSIIKADLDHAVVICELYNNRYGRKQTEIGETTKATLGKTFSNYPVMTAQEMALDRAIIKFLQLPDNCYSVLEFLKNCNLPDERPNDKAPQKQSSGKNIEMQSSDKSGKGEKKEEANRTQNPQENQQKQNVKDYVVNVGIFSNTGLTVQEVFKQAEKDVKIRATLELYLSKNVADIKIQKERYGIAALQKYAKQIGYKKSNNQ